MVPTVLKPSNQEKPLKRLRILLEELVNFILYSAHTTSVRNEVIMKRRELLKLGGLVGVSPFVPHLLGAGSSAQACWRRRSTGYSTLPEVASKISPGGAHSLTLRTAPRGVTADERRCSGRMRPRLGNARAMTMKLLQGCLFEYDLHRRLCA